MRPLMGAMMAAYSRLMRAVMHGGRAVAGVGLGQLQRRLGLQPLLRADGLGLGQRLVALHLGLGLRHGRVGTRLGGLGAGQAGAVGRVVQLVERLAGLDVLPSVNSRLATMPGTRARTWATRQASSRPGSSVTSGTAAGCTVTTPTVAGGMPPPGGPLGASAFGPQAARAASSVNARGQAAARAGGSRGDERMVGRNRKNGQRASAVQAHAGPGLG
jgi:hypothetical protein